MSKKHEGHYITHDLCMPDHSYADPHSKDRRQQTSPTGMQPDRRQTTETGVSGSGDFAKRKDPCHISAS